MPAHRRVSVSPAGEALPDEEDLLFVPHNRALTVADYENPDAWVTCADPVGVDR